MILLFTLLSYEVSGIVVDTAGKPVPGAAVWVEGGPGTYAMPDGSFKLNVPEGASALQAKALGFSGSSSSISSAAGGVKLVLVPTGVTSEEIVVTASARPILLSETPISVNRVEGPEMIRTGGFPRVEEVLKGTPSVYAIGSDPITQVISVRGMARGRSVLLLDGMRLVDDRDVGPAYFVHPSILSSTEIVLGPSSLLYGSGAMGGVTSSSFALPPTYGVPYNTVTTAPAATACARAASGSLVRSARCSTAPSGTEPALPPAKISR